MRRHLEDEFSHFRVETRIERFCLFFNIKADVCTWRKSENQADTQTSVAFLQFSMLLQVQGVESCQFFVSGDAGVKRLGSTILIDALDKPDNIQNIDAQIGMLVRKP